MTETTNRWDPSRLVKTLAFFHVVPFFGSVDWLFPRPAVPVSIKMVPTDSPNSPNSGQSAMVFDFTTPNPQLQELWGAVDDVVMGGVSESQMQFGSGAALFSGVVSTANSGGFVSVQTRNFVPALDLSDYCGIELRLKGDGQRYKFFLRSTSGWDSLAYAASFDTVADRWITVQIPFRDLTPVFRAKTVPDAAPFNAAGITSMQLMLSKFEYDSVLNPHFQPGPFYLELEAIKAYP
jgi:hypothetical protein